MSRIYCIIGKSGSGKDTIFKELQARTDLKPVVTYTTRPIRANEKEGTDYYFVTIHELSEFEKTGKLIEDRHYNTIHGIWTYATVDDGQIDLTSINKYILITTLEAYKKIRDYFGESNVAPIYIEVEDGIRLERALRREREQKRPGYAEMCRRFLADCEDFSEDKLGALGITRCYENNSDISRCVEDIIRGEGFCEN